MRNPYRVILWGPGAVGQACLRAMADRPDLELVGVLAHSPHKDGVDVGEYIGRAPTGLKMTTDKAAILNLDADVVVYTGSPPVVPDALDDDVVSLLSSGKNVISATCYFNPAFQGPDYVAKFEAACQEGGTSLHGTGEQPGFFYERLAVTLTAMCNRVDTLIMEEWVNVSGTSLETMAIFGVGLPEEKAKEPNPILEAFLFNIFAEELNLVSSYIFGQPVKVTVETNYGVADEDVVLPTGTIAKGTVKDIEYVYSGAIDGKLRLRTTIRWVFSGDDRWKVQIEGDPVSLEADISAFASLKDRSHFRPGDPTYLTSYVTAMPMIQAIPVVCEAPPGIVYPTVFSHSAPDYRAMAGASRAH